MSKKIPLDEDWINITFQVYDAPNVEGTFYERLLELKKSVELMNEKSVSYTHLRAHET